MSESLRFRTILILGAPGRGKGTRGKVLGAIPRFHHLACGDVFRSLDTRTALGQKFVEYSSRRELALDGIPRIVEQAKEIDSVRIAA